MPNLKRRFMTDTITVFDMSLAAEKLSKAVSENVKLGRAIVLYDEAVAEMEKRREDLINIAERLKGTDAEARRILTRLSDTIAF